jgi:phosphoglycolate phosphatase
VTSTPFDVYVFDFDGTLVRTAEAKRKAFFDIFPDSCRRSVRDVLTHNPDGSRHQVIPAMISAARAAGAADARDLDPRKLINFYGEEVRRAVLAAPDMAGAASALERAAQRGTCYIASVTPVDDLAMFLKARSWHTLVREAFGYPLAKGEIVAALLVRHQIAPNRLLVIGDGVSDADAAARNGTCFHRIQSDADLATIPGLEESQHA